MKFSNDQREKGENNQWDRNDGASELQFKLLRNGDKAAYAYFFWRHNEEIYHYIRKMGADEELCKDLTQDAFKRLWKMRDNLKSARHLAGYLYVMARNLYLEHLRKLKVRVHAARELAYTTVQEVAKEEDLELVRQGAMAAMEAAMRGLSVQRRLVLQLLYIKGLDVKMVARLLNLSEQTVRNHKAQATAYLKKNIVIS